MDVVLIAHPTARHAPPAVRARVVATWSTVARVRVRFTEGRGDGERLAREAVADGADAVAAEGDGTLNAVATGLLGTPTALAALPGGSTNVLARAMGLPRDPVAASLPLAAALVAGSTSAFGVGAIGRRLFVANAGAGFDARVVAAVERHPAIKRALGPASYVLAAAAVSARSRPAFRVSVEPGGHRLDAELLTMLNVSPYTYLGPRPLRVVARDGQLDGLAVLALDRAGPRSLVANLHRTLTGGLVDGRAPVDGAVVLRGARRVEVDAAVPVPVQVDGEPLAAARHWTVEHRPEHLRLLVPVPTR